MDRVVDSVARQFNYINYSECLRRKVESFTRLKSNFAMALGLGCLASVPISGPAGGPCGLADIAVMGSVHSDASVHYTQMSSCRSAENVCSESAMREAITNFNLSRSELLLSIAGEGVGATIALGARGLKLRRAMKSIHDIERSYAHLNTGTVTKINREMDRIKGLPLNQRVEALEALRRMLMKFVRLNEN